MAKINKPMTQEEIEMANEILELERLKKEKELAQIAKKKEKELIRLEKTQAELNGEKYIEPKKKNDIAVDNEYDNNECETDTCISNDKSNQNYLTDNIDDITFDKVLSDYLKGLDKKQKKLRLQVIVENLYGAAANPKNKEALRATFFMIERVAGKSTPKTNNLDDDKENPLAQEIHNLAEIMRNKKDVSNNDDNGKEST